MKKPGRTQAAIGAVFFAPFVVASAALFLGKMDSTAWISLMQWLVGTSLGALSVGGGLVKVLRKDAKPEDAPDA